MIYCLVIGKDLCTLYRKNNECFEAEYIDGNPFYRYELHFIKNNIKRLIERLADLNNLEDAEELKFIVVENADCIRNMNVEKFLGDRVKKKVTLDSILIKIIDDLGKNNSLHIDKFGINYDNESYLLKSGKLEQNKYSLLAYNVEASLLINYV